MSKGIKKVASIALPIAGSFFGPVGAALGGAAGGLISGGGLKGAALGAVGGYLSGGAAQSVIGNIAGAPLAQVAGNAALQGPTAGSGLLGAFTGGGVRALTSGISSAATGLLNNPANLIMGIGNQLMAQEGADTAEEAAKRQERMLGKAIQTQGPYSEFGQNAIKQINDIQADPAGYIQNNPFYTSLADDAERRLLANQAAKGKVGSGGTKAALQEQLLTIGNGLVQQQVNTLQNQVGTGQTAANNISNMQGAIGDVQAAGKVGSYNAINQGYQNTINTILAQQALNRAPIYA